MDTNATLIRTTAVSKKTTLAKSTIWLKVSQGLFPKPIKLSPSIYVWKEADIDAWIDALASKDLEVSNEVIK
jgi:prophage regulatory protein